MPSRKRSREASEEAVQRAKEAEVLIANPVLEQAISFIEKSALDICRTAKNPEEAFMGTLRSQSIQQVARLLQAFVADGKNAAAELEEDMRAVRRRQDDEKFHTQYLTAARDARSEFDHITTATREEIENG